MAKRKKRRRKNERQGEEMKVGGGVEGDDLCLSAEPCHRLTWPTTRRVGSFAL